MVAVQHSFDDSDLPPDVATARADVERLAEGLGHTLLAARPEDVRRAARRCFETAAAAERRRERVGERPPFDDEAAAVADDARVRVATAKEQLEVAATEAVNLVTVGNVWGVVGVAGAAVMLSAGVDPTAVPIAAVVLGAAAGPCAASLLAIGRREGARSRLVRAIDEWSRSLAALGVSTRGELEARRIAITAWRTRDVEASVAEDTAAAALAEWEALAGAGVPPQQGPVLAVRLVALRQAQLQLLRALLYRASSSPPPVVDVRVRAHGQPDGWIGDALSRLRGRGMRLWSGR